MTKDEALRLAWGALEDIGDEWGFTSQRTVPKRKEAITAIKEALAQPEQEPVAQCTESDSWNCKYCRKTESCKALQDPRNFASPPQGIYYTPPQRKPLSDEEIETYRHMIDWTAHWSYINFARAIEAAHGIKGQA